MLVDKISVCAAAHGGTMTVDLSAVIPAEDNAVSESSGVSQPSSSSCVIVLWDTLISITEIDTLPSNLFDFAFSSATQCDLVGLLHDDLVAALVKDAIPIEEVCIGGRL